MVRLFAHLVFEDMVCEGAFANRAIGHEVDDILRRRETAAGMLEVVGDMVFRVEVGGKGCCACCSGDDGYLKVSASDNKLKERKWKLTRHDKECFQLVVLF